MQPAFASVTAPIPECLVPLATVYGMPMHTDSKKQPSPEKWLADLLSKALLLEYQQPKKPTKRKAASKKARSGKNSSGLSLSRGRQAAVQPELVFSTEHSAVSRYLGSGVPAVY